MPRPTKALIDLAALVHNCKIAAKHTPGSKILTAVKANAYGHGVVQSAKALENHTDAFGVACIEEALELRDAGINKPIVLLAGSFSSTDVQQAIDNNIEIVVHQLDAVPAIISAIKNRPYRVWLKVDTGMHRLGMTSEDLLKAYQLLAKQPNISMILMTHFASADNMQSPQTHFQWQHFSALAQQLNIPTSISNSALTLDWPDIRGNWIRPGIMLYGASPYNQKNNYFDLRPVMTLVSKVMAIRDVAAGDYVGYGNLWQADSKRKIATIPVGYADGYPSTAKARTPVLLGNQLGKLVGRPCMDMLMVDITELINIKVGDDVVLWGKGLRVETIAQWANTIPHVLLTAVCRHRVELLHI